MTRLRWNQFITLGWCLFIALVIGNCSDSNFAGNSNKKSADIASSGDSDGQDGEGDIGGSAGSDSGDSGGSGVGDSDAGDSDGGSDSGDGGDSDGGSDQDDGDGNDGSIGSDSDDNSKKTRHDMIIRRTREDFDDLKVRVALLDDDDDEVLNKTVELPKDKDVIIKDGCRTNSVTRLRVEFQGGDAIRPGDKCYFEQILSDTEIRVDVDTETFLDGVFGACKAGEDETIDFKCPKTTELIIERF